MTCAHGWSTRMLALWTDKRASFSSHRPRIRLLSAARRVPAQAPTQGVEGDGGHHAASLSSQRANSECGRRRLRAFTPQTQALLAVEPVHALIVRPNPDEGGTAPPKPVTGRADKGKSQCQTPVGRRDRSGASLASEQTGPG